MRGLLGYCEYGIQGWHQYKLGIRCASCGWTVVVGHTGFQTKFGRYALLSRILVRKEGRKEGMRWYTCTTTRCPRPCPTTVISTGLVHCPHGRPRPREGAREGAEQAQRRRRERRWVVTCRWRGVLNVLDDDGERAEWVVGRRSAPWTVLNGPWEA